MGSFLFTLFKGRKVGTDEHGNSYYVERWPRDEYGYRVRRWVNYKGKPEASKVPPRWHAWLHYVTDKLPHEQAVTPQPWEKEHQPNLTGTPDAYYPPGHVRAGGRRAAATGDYEPWVPD